MSEEEEKEKARQKDKCMDEVGGGEKEWVKEDEE